MFTSTGITYMIGYILEFFNYLLDSSFCWGGFIEFIEVGRLDPLESSSIVDKTNKTMSRNQAKLDSTGNFDICFCLIFDH